MSLGAVLLLGTMSLRAASDADDVFTVTTRPEASFPPLPFEAVHDGVFPSYYDWRKAALRKNLDVAQSTVGERVATVRLALRDPAFPRREDSFVHRAREEAARLGANLLCAPDATGKPRAAMDFELWRLRMDATPLPAVFVGLLTEASFRDNAYLKQLMADWSDRARPSHAKPASPPVAGASAATTAPPATPVPALPTSSPPPAVVETPATPSTPPGPATPADTNGTASSAGLPPVDDGTPVELLEIGLIKQRMAAAETVSASSAVPAALPLPAMSPGAVPPMPPAPVLAPPAPGPAAAPPPLPPTRVPPPRPPDAVERRRAVGSGALALVVPGLGQWAAGEKGRGARTFVGQAALVTLAASSEQNVRRNVDRGLDDIYAYRAAKYVAATAWFSQAAATTLRLWPREPAASPTAAGAFSRSLTFPGWGHLYAGRYETGFNVMAWEGFAVYWGTKGELGFKERVALLAATHWAQALWAGLAAGRPLSTGRASPQAGRSGGGLAFEMQDGTPRLVLSRRFGGGAYVPRKCRPIRPLPTNRDLALRRKQTGTMPYPFPQTGAIPSGMGGIACPSERCGEGVGSEGSAVPSRPSNL